MYNKLKVNPGSCIFACKPNQPSRIILALGSSSFHVNFALGGRIKGFLQKKLWCCIGGKLATVKRLKTDGSSATPSLEQVLKVDLSLCIR